MWPFLNEQDSYTDFCVWCGGSGGGGSILVVTAVINHLNLSWSIRFPSQSCCMRAVCFLMKAVAVPLWSRWQVNRIQGDSLDNVILSDIFQLEASFIGGCYPFPMLPGYEWQSTKPVTTGTWKQNYRHRETVKQCGLAIANTQTASTLATSTGTEAQLRCLEEWLD